MSQAIRSSFIKSLDKLAGHSRQQPIRSRNIPLVSADHSPQAKLR